MHMLPMLQFSCNWLGKYRREREERMREGPIQCSSSAAASKGCLAWLANTIHPATWQVPDTLKVYSYIMREHDNDTCASVVDYFFYCCGFYLGNLWLKRSKAHRDAKGSLMWALSSYYVISAHECTNRRFGEEEGKDKFGKPPKMLRDRT